MGYLALEVVHQLTARICNQLLDHLEILGVMTPRDHVRGIYCTPLYKKLLGVLVV